MKFRHIQTEENKAVEEIESIIIFAMKNGATTMRAAELILAEGYKKHTSNN